jgi:hypothetical protein
MGLPCSLMPVVVELNSGSSVPTCFFDGLPCDGKWVLGSPCCCQSVFGSDSHGRLLEKSTVVCSRFKSSVRKK